jgi:hypothetical protein
MVGQVELLIQLNRYLNRNQIAKKTGAPLQQVIRWFQGTPVKGKYRNTLLRTAEETLMWRANRYDKQRLRDAIDAWRDR